jgi:hypothetical protein
LRGEEAIIDADGNITAHLNRVSCCFNPPHFPFVSIPLPIPLPLIWVPDSWPS